MQKNQAIITASGFERPALRALRRRLLDWYRQNARDLPWRRRGDPYAVWLSEIMLQQTQVATVIAYFQRFMAAFPNVAALAAADEHRVMRLWEGLGYYRRARQLHAAAKQIVAEHGGQFPTDAEHVRQLPGIGRYTAGAILSIAFDARMPILEANTIRLFCRLLAITADPFRSDVQRQLWHFAEQLLPRSGSGEFNQALMELGSQICTPRAPKCLICPLAASCQARAAGLQTAITGAKVKPASVAVREAAIVVQHADRVLVCRCRPGERWAGLWDFPRFPVKASAPAELRRELKLKLRQRTDCSCSQLAPLATLKHTVTKYRITLDCFQARAASVPDYDDAADCRWLTLAELEDYPLSTTGRKIYRLVVMRAAELPPG